jgi:hypothetical protein
MANSPGAATGAEKRPYKAGQQENSLDILKYAIDFLDKTM